MAIPVSIIVDVIKTLIELAVKGVININNINKQTKEKLKNVYLEINRNRFILQQCGLLKTSRIAVDDKTFISTVKQLANKEIYPLYNFNKRGIFFPDSKKAVALRKTQYAINYIVTQIDHLKVLTKIKRNDNAGGLRLLVRLRTLDKHLATLEKALLPLGKGKQKIKSA